jgi:alpha 1,3-glucosidase
MIWCRTHYNATFPGWSINTSSIILKERKVRASFLLNGKDAGLWLFVGQLSVGSFHVRVEPVDPADREIRFDILKEPRIFDQHAVNDYNTISFVKNSTSVTIVGSGGMSAVVTFAPFRIHLRAKDQTILIVNNYDQFVFEHDRSVKIPVEPWRDHTETHPNGLTTTGIDVLIPSTTVRLTGWAQRHQPMNLADGEGDAAHRGYNLADYCLSASVEHLIAHDTKTNFGIFWPNPSDTFLGTVSKPEGKKLRFYSEGGYLNMFFFVEPMKTLTGSFEKLVGAPYRAPVWAFGYHQCKWGYHNQSEVVGIIENYTKFNIPYDVQWLDLDHCKGKAPFEWDVKTFPNPKEITDLLATKNRYLVRISDINLPTWEDHIQYQEAKHLRLYMRQLNGKDDYFGSSWPGRCCFVDFMNETASTWYSSKHHYGEGRDFTTNNTFYWNDVNEPSIGGDMDYTFAKDLRHINGLEIRETHNMYGMTQAVSTATGELERDQVIGQPKRRPFVLTRSWFAGVQRWAFAWTGDCMSSFDTLRTSVAMVLVSGLCSHPFVGADVGGFGYNLTEDLMVRWTRASAWVYPFMRSHSPIDAPRREPWVWPKETNERVVTAIMERYLLLAVWYTASVYRHRSGYGPVVPLWVEWPEIEAFHDEDERVLVAGSLLVQPVLRVNQTEIKVIKPPGVWYDFFKGDNMKADFTRNVTMDDIVVHVRGGKILPLFKTPVDSSLNTLPTPLSLLIACDEGGHAAGGVYLDDGISFEYEKGGFVERNFTWENGVLRCLKGNPQEGDIPDLVYDNIIANLDIYQVRPDGTTEVTHITGLQLLLREEWEWSEAGGQRPLPGRAIPRPVLKERED